MSGPGEVGLAGADRVAGAAAGQAEDVVEVLFGDRAGGVRVGDQRLELGQGGGLGDAEDGGGGAEGKRLGRIGADQVDAGPEPLQPSLVYAVLDRLVAQSGRAQLGDRQHPVATGQPHQIAVARAANAAHSHPTAEPAALSAPEAD
jgi:hypothetical protein